MELSGMIFDMDGVLIDSEPVHIESWLILFEREKIDAHDIDFESAIGLTDEAFLRSLKERGKPVFDVEALGLSKQQIYQEICTDRFTPQPGAADVVRHFARTVPVALATSDHRCNAVRNIERLGLSESFRAILSRDDVSRCKPDPEIYLRAAESLDVPPSGCVAVEDSPSGVAAARRANLRCVAVAVSVPAAWLGEANWVVDRIQDVPKLFNAEG